LNFEVRYLDAARTDLIRLYDYLVDKAETIEDLARADIAYDAIVSAIDSLSRTPFVYRKAAESPFLRELLIPFGAAGYVALFEIVDARRVHVLAIRHQLEDDYH
tara:strand:+ start:343 stop:654 length:312 start_codon:yes stop_codon:yes gene_type:complete